MEMVKQCQCAHSNKVGDSVILAYLGCSFAQSLNWWLHAGSQEIFFLCGTSFMFWIATTGCKRVYLQRQSNVIKLKPMVIGYCAITVGMRYIKYIYKLTRPLCQYIIKHQTAHIRLKSEVFSWKKMFGRIILQISFILLHLIVSVVEISRYQWVLSLEALCNYMETGSRNPFRRS